VGGKTGTIVILYFSQKGYYKNILTKFFSMMHHMNRMSRYCHRPGLGLLLIRAATGLVFFHHGWLKLMNVSGTVHFMSILGIPAGLAYVAIFVEVVGGLMLILGIWTRPAAVATGIVALVAAFVAVVPNKGFLGAEFELLLAAVSFGIALIGAGRLRLAHMFEHDRENTAVSSDTQG
jgi:putative oxidoreductase